jgi:sulfoxide reductase heme-binding subunit YedZ
MIGFALLVPLAITSNNKSIRRLGPVRWNRLHKLTYGAVILGAIHNVMVQKVWETESVLYLVIIVALLALRMPIPKRIAA